MSNRFNSIYEIFSSDLYKYFQNFLSDIIVENLLIHNLRFYFIMLYFYSLKLNFFYSLEHLIFYTTSCFLRKTKTFIYSMLFSKLFASSSYYEITGNLGPSGRVYLNSAQKMLLESARAYFKKLRCARQF